MVPALHRPENITAHSVNNSIVVSWELLPVEYDNFTVTLKYCLYSINNTCSEIELDSNASSHVIDTSQNRGQPFLIGLFLRSPYGESESSETLNIRSGKSEKIC